METGYEVGEIMTNSPVTMKSDSTIKECVDEMKAHDVGSVLIIENKKLHGIITEKDIVMKLVAEGLDAKETLAKDIMTEKEDMTFISPDKDIYDALIVMKENQVRRLPVMQNGEIKGLITLNDVLKIEPELFDIMVEKIKIREEDRKLGVGSEEEYVDDDEP